MNFENIDTNLLRNSINQCIESINYTNSEQIINSIMDDNTWGTLSRDNFRRALETLINEDYKNLEMKLKQFLEAVDVIEKYKEKNSDLTSQSTLINELNEKLELAEENYSSFKTSNNLETNEALEVSNEIASLKEEISNNTKSMDSNEVELLKIKNKIESLIN